MTMPNIDINEEFSSIQWQEITIEPGDNLSLLFPKVGLNATDVYNVAKLNKQIKPLLDLKPGPTSAVWSLISKQSLFLYNNSNSL